ncbi:hypothetical protein PK98_09435 [Croceibacterium mercuriale]|uniref:Uncharacterized protein n=2 Tax=Croceibacterium mercuriale TaxID=1572751 RepID=A0A0B2C333_9SPHN|nr:hypothetical protein PK98_09435 [Croceibacterium mercuriale]
MADTPAVTRSLMSAPLPQIIEQLGLSIARAQSAMDINSVAIAKSMAETKVMIGDEEHTLLSLGFAPSFYAFTEATVEAKLSFSMSETTETSVDVSVSGGGGVGFVMFAASVDVGYARKFSVGSEGQSSIAARIVSLPPPDQLTAVLRRHNEKN